MNECNKKWCNRCIPVLYYNGNILQGKKKNLPFWTTLNHVAHTHRHRHRTRMNKQVNCAPTKLFAMRVKTRKVVITAAFFFFFLLLLLLNEYNVHLYFQLVVICLNKSPMIAKCSSCNIVTTVRSFVHLFIPLEIWCQWPNGCIIACYPQIYIHSFIHSIFNHFEHWCFGIGFYPFTIMNEAVERNTSKIDKWFLIVVFSFLVFFFHRFANKLFIFHFPKSFSNQIK